MVVTFVGCRLMSIGRHKLWTSKSTLQREDLEKTECYANVSLCKLHISTYDLQD